eukprot:TRINITY_DN1725_c0_g1_i1.p1 TRINITY_DN1725_c0_g1~~TRINITY_DN1725_c0_g1_i1.p1  ORF type:complete len:391 (-),score=31.99 TRINITY_DN1725_c0_g1_i1:38-1210(-)
MIHRLYCFTIAIFLLIIVVLSVDSVVFPYTIQTQMYNATWKNNNPYLEIYAILPNETTPQLIFAIDVDSIIEVKAKNTIYDFTTGNEFNALVQNQSITIRNVSLRTADYDVIEINEPNNRGLMFIAEFEDGFRFEYNFTINELGPKSLKIPRLYGDQNCNTTSQNIFQLNCSCETHHTLDAESLKIAFKLSNWTFEEENPDYRVSLIGINAAYIGPFNIDYYLNVKDSASLISFPVCDVGVGSLNLSNGNVIVDLSYFTLAWIDGYASQIFQVEDTKSFSFIDNVNIKRPFTLLFGAFEHEIVYDPDFSILIGPTANSGSNFSGNKNTSKNNVVVIIVSVIVPVVVVGVIVIVVVGLAVTLLLRRRMQKKMKTALSNLVLVDQTAPSHSL